MSTIPSVVSGFATTVDMRFTAAWSDSNVASDVSLGNLDVPFSYVLPRAPEIDPIAATTAIATSTVGVGSSDFRHIGFFFRTTAPATYRIAGAVTDTGIAISSNSGVIFPTKSSIQSELFIYTTAGTTISLYRVRF